MPPRSRRQCQRSPGDVSKPLNLLQLDPGLLERILHEVPQPDVRCNVALVCKQLYELQKNSKAIWSTCDLTFAAANKSKSRVNALLNWLGDHRHLTNELCINIRVAGWLNTVAGLLLLVSGSALRTLKLSTTDAFEDSLIGTWDLLVPLQTMHHLTHLEVELKHARTDGRLHVPSLHRLTQLKGLSWDLGEGCQAVMPSGLDRLTSLTSLATDFCLERGPRMISQLTQLEEVSLFCMPSQQELQDPFLFLTAFTRLHSLGVCDARQPQIPAAVCTLTQLTWLHWVGSNLSNLPASTSHLQQLTNLEELELTDDRLPGLPPQLTALTALQRLVLSHNQSLVADQADFEAMLASLPCLSELVLDQAVSEAVGSVAWVELGRMFTQFTLQLTLAPSANE